MEQEWRGPPATTADEQAEIEATKLREVMFDPENEKLMPYILVDPMGDGNNYCMLCGSWCTGHLEGEAHRKRVINGLGEDRDCWRLSSEDEALEYLRSKHVEAPDEEQEWRPDDEPAGWPAEEPSDEPAGSLLAGVLRAVKRQRAS